MKAFRQGNGGNYSPNEVPDLTPQVSQLRVLVDLAWGYTVQNDFEMLPDRFPWAFILMADLIDQIEEGVEVLDQHARRRPEKVEAMKDNLNEGALSHGT